MVWTWAWKRLPFKFTELSSGPQASNLVSNVSSSGFLQMCQEMKNPRPRQESFQNLPSRARQFQEPCSCENRARKRQKNSDEAGSERPKARRGALMTHGKAGRGLGGLVGRSETACGAAAGVTRPAVVSASRMHRLPIIGQPLPHEPAKAIRTSSTASELPFGISFRLVRLRN